MQFGLVIAVIELLQLITAGIIPLLSYGNSQLSGSLTLELPRL